MLKKDVTILVSHMGTVAAFDANGNQVPSIQVLDINQMIRMVVSDLGYRTVAIKAPWGNVPYADVQSAGGSE